ncbi:35189_t:CDS:2 [Racocetra persica]|uniref:35189_t:CDS:1 n=1 Tax=Racocetra persica TaxID=160502 RepID=A0ACA9NL84_9GLOM|nr:35189_t:CDS:2 [Racocetra persica]
MNGTELVVASTGERDTEIEKKKIFSRTKQILATLANVKDYWKDASHRLKS